MEHGHPAPVYIAAQVFRDMCYRYRDDFSAGLLVAGWDEQKGGQVKQHGINCSFWFSRSVFFIHRFIRSRWAE